MARRALITGITGQDGSYLAEYLLDQGYEVWGLARGQANPRVSRIRKLLADVHLVRGDLLDQSSLISAVERVQPDEVYNLGAISFVPMSWEQAELTAEVTGMGVLRMLEAIRVCSGVSRGGRASGGQIRFYQASSSEMFGQVSETPQNESTGFHPRSPYGVAKAYGHFLTQNYRESYGMFAVSGILFNHESPRRGAEFVPISQGPRSQAFLERFAARVHEAGPTNIVVSHCGPKGLLAEVRTLMREQGIPEKNFKHEHFEFR